MFEHDVLFEHEVDHLFETPLGFGPRVAPFPPGAAFSWEAGPGFAQMRVGGPMTVAGLKEQLTQIRADRDAAQGKMDLASVDALLRSAERLIGQAESRQTAQPTPVVEAPRPGVFIRKVTAVLSPEAHQAAAQLRAAQAQLEAGVPGILPSLGQRASRGLSTAHRIVSDVAGATRANAEAAALVTQSQGLYRQGYDAYQAGQYASASAHAHAALATAEAARALAAPEPKPPRAPGVPPAPPPPTF